VGEALRSKIYTNNLQQSIAFLFRFVTESVLHLPLPVARHSVPRVRQSTYGGRAFSYVGPSAWNALPDFLKTIHFLCLLLDANLNISTSTSSTSLSHFTSRPSAFEVILQNALYKLLTYLLTYLLPPKTLLKTSDLRESHDSTRPRQAVPTRGYATAVLLFGLFKSSTHCFHRRTVGGAHIAHSTTHNARRFLRQTYSPCVPCWVGPAPASRCSRLAR